MVEANDGTIPSNTSESSTRKVVPTKRRAPSRSSRRITRKESTNSGQPKIQRKQECKAEKKKVPHQTPDISNRETVITEHGYSIHPNGLGSSRTLLTC